MGQSYSLTTPYAGSAGIDVPQLADLVHERSIGSARFMKSIRARNYDGVVLVKVTVKPHTPMSLSEHGERILRMADNLQDTIDYTDMDLQRSETNCETSQTPSASTALSRPTPMPTSSASICIARYTIACPLGHS